ncbi:oxygenase MpaB family protein [Rhodococcus sp. C3V]|nr:oxygenase MpaB family protein [Rhodococcus sp. C3V]
MSRRLVTGRAVGRRIDELDPELENEEAIHLSLEVRYGDAVFAHAAYTVAFARQVAIPSIARVVYRKGTGDMIHDVRKRNDDTLLFFGEMMRHGHSSAYGRSIIDRMEQIHSRFGITDDDKLYTLGSLAFEPDRIVEHLGLDIFTDNERVSRYFFWRNVGERMGLKIPPTRDAFLAWIFEYENKYGYTEGGRALVDQLFLDWQDRWFPGPTRHFADNLLLAMFDDNLRRIHRLEAPPTLLSKVVPPVAGAYLAFQSVRPHRPHRSWSDHFGARHPKPLDVPTLGHRPRVVHPKTTAIEATK